MDWNSGRGREARARPDERATLVTAFILRLTRLVGWEGAADERKEGRKGQKHMRAQEEMTSIARATKYTVPHNARGRWRWAATAAEISFHNCVRWKYRAASGSPPSLPHLRPSVRSCVRCPSAANKCCCRRGRRPRPRPTDNAPHPKCRMDQNGHHPGSTHTRYLSYTYSSNRRLHIASSAKRLRLRDTIKGKGTVKSREELPVRPE